MEPEDKLLVLKSLMDMPQRPGQFAIPGFPLEDPFVEVPKEVKNYIIQMGGSLEVDDKGRMHINKFLEMLREYHLDHLMISPPPIFVTYTPELMERIRNTNQ